MHLIVSSLSTGRTKKLGQTTEQIYVIMDGTIQHDIVLNKSVKSKLNKVISQLATPVDKV